MKIPDNVWEVIKDYLYEYFRVRATEDVKVTMETDCMLHPFDGGMFISKGNHFDLFVVPEKRGCWRIRTTFNEFIEKMINLYGSVCAIIHPRNVESLRLAVGFGFIKQTENAMGMFVMEKR